MSDQDPIADNLRRQIEALVLEREAALARLERVRKLLPQFRHRHLMPYGETFAQMLEAALADGEPDN